MTNAKPIREELNIEELNYLQTRREEFSAAMIQRGPELGDSEYVIAFVRASVLIRLGYLKLESTSEQEAFAVIVGDQLITEGDFPPIDWCALVDGNRRSIGLRGYEYSGGTITLAELTERLKVESNLFYFMRRLERYLTSDCELDDDIETTNDFKCRCGETCRIDAFSPGFVRCKRCNVGWNVANFDCVGHFECEIETPGEFPEVYGVFSRVVYSEDRTCCSRCGYVYIPGNGKRCPILILRAIEMLEPRGKAGEIPASEKAKEFLVAHKEQLRECWPELRSQLPAGEQSLARIGLLSEIV